jgi:sporulation related protein
MADRYSNRPFAADDYNRGSDQHGSGGAEGDPLAELARLIGQTDPFGATGRQAPPVPPPQRAAIPREPYPQQYDAPVEEEDEPSAPSGPPSWMQRANITRAAPPPAEYPDEDEGQDYSSQDYASQGYPSQDYPSQNYQGQDHPNAVHPLHRYAAQPAAHHDGYDAQSYGQGDQQADPSRYDDALYGQLESGAQDFQREPTYPDDPYAYQDGYEDEPEEAPKRRGGLLTVAAVLALAVVGTGAAFAYRTYLGPSHSGEPPVIRADNSPTKIVPTSSDSSKTPDRMPTGDGSEKLVPREETPVDVNARAAGPRVVFPPLNANNNPPPPSSVATNAMPPAAPSTNGTMPNSEPRKVRTQTIRGDQADASAVPMTAPPATAPAAVPATRPAAATRQVPPPPAMRAAPAPAGNAPLSLSPDSAQASVPPVPAEPRTRMAATTPSQTEPAEQAPAGEGRFLVSITSQPTEAEAQASYRAMQRKYPDQLGSRSPVIKKYDGKKGTGYRALVGPFASREEATRFCTGYTTAGGQCWIP